MFFSYVSCMISSKGSVISISYLKSSRRSFIYMYCLLDASTRFLKIFTWLTSSRFSSKPVAYLISSRCFFRSFACLISSRCFFRSSPAWCLADLPSDLSATWFSRCCFINGAFLISTVEDVPSDLHSKNWRTIKLPTERRLLRLNFARNQKNCLGN